MSQHPRHTTTPIDPDSNHGADPGAESATDAVRERDMPGNPLGPDQPEKARGATRQDSEPAETPRN